MQKYRAINSSQVFYGVGRQKDQGQIQFAQGEGGEMVDKFVVTRSLNQSGLVFNQKISNDMSNVNRFFNLNAHKEWELSKNNECKYCEKHAYTMVFY